MCCAGAAATWWKLPLDLTDLTAELKFHSGWHFPIYTSFACLGSSISPNQGQKLFEILLSVSLHTDTKKAIAEKLAECKKDGVRFSIPPRKSVGPTTFPLVAIQCNEEACKFYVPVRLPLFVVSFETFPFKWVIPIPAPGEESEDIQRNWSQPENITLIKRRENT